MSHRITFYQILKSRELLEMCPVVMEEADNVTEGFELRCWTVFLIKQQPWEILATFLSNWAKAKTRLEWFRYKTGSKHETAKTSAKQSYSFRNGAFAWFLPNGALSNFCRTMSRTLRRSSLWISEYRSTSFWNGASDFNGMRPPILKGGQCCAIFAKGGQACKVAFVWLLLKVAKPETVAFEWFMQKGGQAWNGCPCTLIFAKGGQVSSRTVANVRFRKRWPSLKRWPMLCDSCERWPSLKRRPLYHFFAKGGQAWNGGLCSLTFAKGGQAWNSGLCFAKGGQVSRKVANILRFHKRWPSQ